MQKHEFGLEDPLHTAESAAQLLGISPATIRSWWHLGKLPRLKIGKLSRVRESSLLALIKPEQPKREMSCSTN